jgi:predicted lipoprotein
MPKKLLSYIMVIVLIGFIGYKSVYIKKLDEEKAARSSKFDATDFAGKLWKEQLPAQAAKAIDLAALFDALRTHPEETFSKYGHSIGITNTASFLVHSSGQVAAISEDDVLVSVRSGDSSLVVKITMEYVYGNTIRDASGLVDIRDFTNAMDLNNISEELNKLVRTTVVPPFKDRIQKGSRIEFTGALELNKEHLKLNEPEIIPVALKIIP